jgi:hypothetical protein
MIGIKVECQTSLEMSAERMKNLTVKIELPREKAGPMPHGKVLCQN